MLRFVDAGERDAMRYYLGSRLDGLKKTVSFFGVGRGDGGRRKRRELTCVLVFVRGFAGVDAEDDDRYLAGGDLSEQV